MPGNVWIPHDQLDESHVCLNVIHEKVFQKLEDNISDIQFGFRNDYSPHKSFLDINQKVPMTYLLGKVHSILKEYFLHISLVL